ncbi:hypothetical protein F441_14389, partial [Phytophthora nicotianae CJ01A1]
PFSKCGKKEPAPTRRAPVVDALLAFPGSSTARQHRSLHRVHQVRQHDLDGAHEESMKAVALMTRISA